MSALIERNPVVTRRRLTENGKAANDTDLKPVLTAELQRPGEMRRFAPGVGATGVPPIAIYSLIGVYAFMLMTFWLFFGSPVSALTLGVITVFAIMFFGLLGGAIVLADSAPANERQRRFSEFLEGRVQIATGWISGKEAFAQIITLPIALAIGALAIGIVKRLTVG